MSPNSKIIHLSHPNRILIYITLPLTDEMNIDPRMMHSIATIMAIKFIGLGTERFLMSRSPKMLSLIKKSTAANTRPINVRTKMETEIPYSVDYRVSEFVCNPSNLSGCTPLHLTSSLMGIL